MKQILIVSNKDCEYSANYCNAVETAGARAVFCNLTHPAQSVKNCDGIILPGGTDINPKLYKQPNTDSRDIDDSLDMLDVSIIACAVKQQKPILGICRGLQMLNVFFGGTLMQNVPHCAIHERQHTQDKIHATTVAKNSFLYKIYRTEKLVVNSAHHQAIETLGNDLVAVQHSDDGLIEALCHKTLPFIAVQWHPERMCCDFFTPAVADGLVLFTYFITLL
ncbi:MAG: gamma-glutamyl-gamma-aminobutyrate hydrolase family protein [Treponema sp.]|nr:gamma-glutamyl-gamma-aminobutyrate hydrolase family protein [Treponema sp.]